MPLDPTKTVHVKDLHYDVHEQELFVHFSSVGQVSSVKLHRDRQTRQSLGFAFITYFDPNHASAAVAQLHYSNMRNQPIVVMWVGEHEALDPEANLFVRSLDQNISNDQLYELFATFGRVISAKIMVDTNTQISKGYGYVQFESATDAYDAMGQLQGYLFGAYQLQIDVFRPKASRYPGNTSIPSTYGGYDDGSGYNDIYEGAYEDAYQAVYAQSPMYGYDGYESYYYGDSSAGQDYVPTAPIVPSAMPPTLIPPTYQQSSATTSPPSTTTTGTATSSSGNYTVNLRVVDESKGTLTDLSPSAPEWRPPPGASTSNSNAKTSTSALINSSLKPDSPVFVPGSSSSKANTLSVSTSNNTPNSSIGSKLSPNAPVWTGNTTSATTAVSSNTISTAKPAADISMTTVPSPKSSSSANAPILTLPSAANSTNISTSPPSLLSKLHYPALSSTEFTNMTSSLLSFPSSSTSTSSTTHSTTSNAPSIPTIPPSTPFSSTNIRLPVSPSSPSTFAFSPTLLTSTHSNNIAEASNHLVEAASSSTGSTANRATTANNNNSNTSTSTNAASSSNLLFPFAFSLSSSATFPATPSSPFPLTSSSASSNSTVPTIEQLQSQCQSLYQQFIQMDTIADSASTNASTSQASSTYQQQLLVLIALLQSFLRETHTSPSSSSSSTPTSILFPTHISAAAEEHRSILSSIDSVNTVDNMINHMHTCTQQLIQRRVQLSSSSISTSTLSRRIGSNNSQVLGGANDSSNGRSDSSGADEEEEASDADMLLMANASGFRTMTSFD